MKNSLKTPVPGKKGMYRIPNSGPQKGDTPASFMETAKVMSEKVSLNEENEILMFRKELEDTYAFLTSEKMPKVAKENSWPIESGFQRVVLDMTFGGCWLDHVEKRPAYENMAIEHLVQAVCIAKMLMKNRGMVEHCNNLSLTYRRENVA